MNYLLSNGGLSQRIIRRWVICMKNSSGWRWAQILTLGTWMWHHEEPWRSSSRHNSWVMLPGTSLSSMQDSFWGIIVRVQASSRALWRCKQRLRRGVWLTKYQWIEWYKFFRKAKRCTNSFQWWPYLRWLRADADVTLRLVGSCGVSSIYISHPYVLECSSFEILRRLQSVQIGVFSKVLWDSSLSFCKSP